MSNLISVLNGTCRYFDTNYTSYDELILSCADPLIVKGIVIETISTISIGLYFAYGIWTTMMPLLLDLKTSEILSRDLASTRGSDLKRKIREQCRRRKLEYDNFILFDDDDNDNDNEYEVGPNLHSKGTVKFEAGHQGYAKTNPNKAISAGRNNL